MNNVVSEEVVFRMQGITALLLWQSGAIKVDSKNPFKLVSGNYSPIYINCRLVISNAAFMRLFNAFSAFICQYYNIKFDIVAGGETAGIPFAAHLAQTLALPMIYVRKSSKQHGIATLIEGIIPPDSSILLVEDLITDGKSKVNFVKSIHSSGGKVEHVLVLFDRLQGGGKLLKKEGIRLHALTDMQTAMRIVKKVNLLNKTELASLHEYLLSPREWHVQRGLSFEA